MLNHLQYTQTTLIMATAANSCPRPGRVGWVKFADDGSGNQTDHETVAHGFLESSSAPADPSSEAVVLPSPQNAWVLFDETPWHPPTPTPQVKAIRNSVCSTASFWSDAPASDSSSTTGQSEQSFGSNGSRLCPADPCMLVDDEGIETDSSRFSSGVEQTNTGPSSGLNLWVTFEDDQKATQPPISTPMQPSPIRLDTVLPHPQALQDGNGNPMVAHAYNQNRGQIEGLVHPLLVLAPNGSSNGGVHSSVDSSASCAKKNPFLNKAFDDVKPSCINPFVSFFDSGEKLKQWPQGHSDRGSDAVSPAHQSLIPQAIVPPGERGGEAGGSRGDVFHVGPLTTELDELERRSSLQVSDPDGTGGWDDLHHKTGGERAQDQPAEDEPYLPSHMVPQDGWPMLLRIPEKKNIMSSRHWGPIYVRLSDDGSLRLFYERGLEKPFRSLRLQPQHEVSEHRLQSYEDGGCVHTLSVELLQYREKRRIPTKLPVPLQPVREQLIKLATSCYHDYLSFRHALTELLNRLPGTPSPAPAGANAPGVPVQPSEEELQVEVRDEFYGTVAAGDGKILKQLVITRVNVLALFSGLPRCRLGLNDVQVEGKELVSRHDIVHNSTTRWIPLQDPRLHHGHADEAEFLDTRTVAFTPPPHCRFELLRFRTPYAERTPPFTLRTVASVRGAEVCVQSWLLMSRGFAPNLDPLSAIPCENVLIRYPIPEIWAKNFRREGVIGEKSLKARFNKGASFGSASASGAEPAMRVTLGSAKYEQAFKAVVWRIPRLPDKNSSLGHPHTFFCRLELGSDQEVPYALEHHVDVEFDMPAAAASKATVRSLSVDDRTDMRKWINYKSHFFYQVPIEQKREDDIRTGNMPADEPGECSHQ